MSSYGDYSSKTPQTTGGTPQKTGDEIQKSESKRKLPRTAQLKQKGKEGLRKEDQENVEKSDKKAEILREKNLPKSADPAPYASSSTAQLRARPSFSEDDEKMPEERPRSLASPSSSATALVSIENEADRIRTLYDEKRNLKLIVDSKESHPGEYDDETLASANQQIVKIETELKALGKSSEENWNLISELHEKFFPEKAETPQQHLVSIIPEVVVSTDASPIKKTDSVAKSPSSPLLTINMAERQKHLKEKGKQLFEGATTTPTSAKPSSASTSTTTTTTTTTTGSTPIPPTLEQRRQPILNRDVQKALENISKKQESSTSALSSTAATSTSGRAKESEDEEMDLSEKEEAAPLQKKPDKKAHDQVEKATKLTKEEETAKMVEQLNNKNLDFFKGIDKSSDTVDRFKACDTLDRLALLIAEKHMTSEVIENLQSIAKNIKGKISSLAPSGQTKSEAQERLEKSLAIYQNKLNPLRKSLLLESKDQFITNLKNELAKKNNIELVCTRLNHLAEEITEAEVVVSDDLSNCLTQVRNMLKAVTAQNDILNTTIDIYNHLCSPCQDNLNTLDLLLQDNENFTSQNLPLMLDIAFHYTLLKSDTSHVGGNLTSSSILHEGAKIEDGPPPQYTPSPPLGDDEPLVLPTLPESSSEGELENNIDQVLNRIKQIYDKSDAKGKNLIIERLEFECSRIIISARKNGPELWLTDNDHSKIKTFLANIKAETKPSSIEKTQKELKIKEKKQEKAPKKDALMHSLYGNDIMSYRNLPEVEDITYDLYNSMADLYSQIKAEELSQPNTCPSVQAMIDHQEQVMCWIMKSIYAGKKPKERGKIIEKFIRVQSELLDKGDMLTASYIFNTLQSVNISGLKDSWKEVSKKVHERLTELNELFSPMGSFKNRRDYQQKLLDKNIPFIPDLMLHIKDAKVAEEVDAAAAYRIRDKYGPLINNVKQFKALHATALGQRNTTINQVISKQILPTPKMLDKTLDALRKDKSLEENIT